MDELIRCVAEALCGGRGGRPRGRRRTGGRPCAAQRARGHARRQPAARRHRSLRLPLHLLLHRSTDPARGRCSRSALTTGSAPAVLLRALERNREEGDPGTLVTLDTTPHSGWLIPARFAGRLCARARRRERDARATARSPRLRLPHRRHRVRLRAQALSVRDRARPFRVVRWCSPPSSRRERRATRRPRSRSSRARAGRALRGVQRACPRPTSGPGIRRGSPRSSPAPG